MKKPYITVLLPVLLGIVFMAGCPNNLKVVKPDNVRLENADIVLDKGQYWYYFFEDISDITSVEFGKNYEVLLDVTELDDRLAGCHFQIQVYYVVADPNGNRAAVFKNETRRVQDYLIAARQNAKPQNVATTVELPYQAIPLLYRIPFAAGYYFSSEGVDERDPAAVLAKSGEVIDYNIAFGATGDPAVPFADATLAVKLIARTPNWYVIGVPWNNQVRDPQNGRDLHDDPSIFSYYSEDPAQTSGWGVNATISLREQPDFSQYVIHDTVLVNDPGTNSAEHRNWGFIKFAEFEKLLNAPPDSFLRIVCAAQVSATATGGTSGARPGWGIGALGSEAEKPRGQEVTLTITVPAMWNDQPLLIDGPGRKEFYVDLYVDTILALSLPTETLLNMNNTGEQLSMTIYSPPNAD